MGKKYTRHHLTPKVKGGTISNRNILYIKRDWHNLWHELFGNMNLREVIELLEDLEKTKRTEPETLTIFKGGEGDVRTLGKVVCGHISDGERLTVGIRESGESD